MTPTCHAYPGEGKPGCLRDARLRVDRPTPPSRAAFISELESTAQDLLPNEDAAGAERVRHAARLLRTSQPETWKVLPSPAGAPPPDDELRDILGRPCFTLISMAQMLRSIGHDIKRRAEDEQAVSILWMLGLYMKHDSEWRTEAARIILEFKDGLSKLARRHAVVAIG
ncbi:hypothetical protein [Noviherbaspirillum suwonense]|nr:hypothetical protein [Noviherbaspirillum suwonense]